MKLNYFSAAAATSKKAAAMHPSAETKRELAVALWRSGERPAAISQFEDAIRKYPRDAQTLQEYGTLLLEDATAENKARAVAVLKQAIAMNGSSVEARYQLANVALEENRLPDALEHLEKAIRADPDDNRLHFTLSRVYRRLGREADAESEMQKYQKLKKSVE
jgi:tetratricopeptide (TPR) repeat protein